MGLLLETGDSGRGAEEVDGAGYDNLASDPWHWYILFTAREAEVILQQAA